ncbi:peptide transporter [[Bacillus] sp. KCTC 13219]|nr:peptide transporter [[Bacillus] sp. KCTC 13219]
MKKYVFRRILMGLLTIFVVFTINFILIRMAPGSPISTLMGRESDDPILRAALEEKYGFDKPVVVQYFIYLKNAATGDLGLSIIYNKDVMEMITERIVPTLLLVLSAAILAVIIGTFMGMYAAKNEGSKIDVFFSAIAYIFNSMPAFWLGLILIIVFSSILGLLPSYGMINSRSAHTGTDYILDVIVHMILPVSTLVLVEIPIYFRIAKSSILQVANEDFIVTLRATGMSERKIFNKYILRNAILPTITIFGISMGYLITGVALIETVFSWPGTGSLMLNAINQRDYPTLMGIYLIMSISVAFVMVLVDIVYAVLDPRIRF